MTDLRAQLQATLGDAYTLNRELGGGGMSRVFVADEARFDRKVVVKVLSPDLAHGLSGERFQREIKVAASLQQANIVPVLSAGDTGGLPFFTMPYVEGESLRARLARGPLSITEVIGILRDVAKALAYAHSRGVVHRDIKPDNVLVSGGTAVVTDFGIAKAISASRTDSGEGATLTQLGTSIGTPAYMAPEQAAGDPDIDHRADIYSYGCMAFELLAGVPPFAGRTPQRVLAAHMSEVPRHVAELRPDTPPALAALVMSALAKDAADRPQAASVLVGALESMTSGDGHTAAPPILAAAAGTLRKALFVYAVAFVLVAVFAKAAISVVGLPDWTFTGALMVMALGLPVILVTGYVHNVSRRAYVTTPALTPGGTPVRPTHGTMASLALKASPHVSWRRTTLGGAAAFGGFVLLVGGFMLLRSLGIGPFGTLFAAGKLPQRPPILITDFTTVNAADTSLGSLVADALRAALGQSTAITLVGPQQVANTLRLMQHAADSRINLALARQIAERDGVPAILDGNVRGVGDEFLVTVSLVSADSGRELAIFRERARGPSELLDVADRIARDVRERIGESLRSVQRAQPLARVATSSMEALRKYSQGSRANDVEIDYAKAVRLLREAVTIDSSFAMAWRKLGLSLSNARRPRAQVDSALERAYAHRNRLTEIERYLVTAAYYANGPGRDRARAIAAYEAILAAGDSGPLNNLALRYSSRRDFARAESLYRRARAMNRNFPLATSNLIGALVNEGKIDEAWKLNEDALREFPASAAFHSNKMAFSFVAGRYDDHERELDSALKVASPVVRRRLATYRTNLALLRGGLEEYRQGAAANMAVDDEAASDDGLNPVIDEAWVRAMLVGRAVDLRRLDSAIASPAFLARAEVDRPYFDAAGVYALAGRPDRARALFARADAEIRDTVVRRAQQPVRNGVLGEILLAEGKAREAADAFRKGDSLPDGPSSNCTVCLPFALARAYDAMDMPDSAIAMFEKYLGTSNTNRIAMDPVILAPITKRLGELYAIRGDTAKAIMALQKFVDLWKNADPVLQPQVADAKLKLQLWTSRGRR
jgi:tetratricopeptide (TPR) repeat protein/tRNA A-37 threonylcarbamoyl transferase component Bud32